MIIPIAKMIKPMMTTMPMPAKIQKYKPDLFRFLENALLVVSSPGLRPPLSSSLMLTPRGMTMVDSAFLAGAAGVAGAAEAVYGTGPQQDDADQAGIAARRAEQGVGEFVDQRLGLGVADHRDALGRRLLPRRGG